MNIGTKSILFGVHQFIWHPLFVAAAWYKLYGFPYDIRLWFAFVMHDWGYWGKPNMDGAEGETHPETGGRLMTKLFGKEWGDFCLLHSRYYARKLERNMSKLCVADKMAFTLMPFWFYVTIAKLSGEWYEYTGNTSHTPANGRSEHEWYDALKAYTIAWSAEHKDGREDTWTGTGKDRAMEPPKNTNNK